MNFTMKGKTALSLGLSNLFRVFKYRIGIKTGLNPVQKLVAELPSGKFFASEDNVTIQDSWSTELTAFGYLTYPIKSNYPNWFYSPLTDKVLQDSDKPWYQIPDFDQNIGDIKGVWEASRFDWVLDFVLQERNLQNGEPLKALDAWLNNWCEQNPAYFGPNWKCGQEASIRVMHLISALLGLGQLHEANKNIISLLEVHLQRIEPTIDYAIAQNNNHGTSEATALFIGGTLLNSLSPSKKYQKWAKIGRKWLENRADTLIMKDGGFSQYSVNYHRVMLDSYCLAEVIRQELELPSFSKQLYLQLKKAVNWLYILTQNSGDAPNLGANDGARLLPVCDTGYRDFRPTIQLGSTLFHEHSFYQESGSYDEILNYFSIQKKKQDTFKLPKKNQFFNKSGLITTENQEFFLLFKIPIFKYRPSQCDVLHIDVWWRNHNILRDGGSYSYNSTPEDLEYFKGVASHNTIQFDNHQQMPKLSRFLFGAWLKPKNLRYSPEKFFCGYKDYWGCEHHRDISLTKNQIIIEDSISGFREEAVLRWRLKPSNWVLKDNLLSDGEITLRVESEQLLEISLVEGEESRYYYKKETIPVLEVRMRESGKVVTVVAV